MQESDCNIVYDIVYDTIYDIVYDTLYDIVYDTIYDIIYDVIATHSKLDELGFLS